MVYTSNAKNDHIFCNILSMCITFLGVTGQIGKLGKCDEIKKLSIYSNAQNHFLIIQLKLKLMKTKWNIHINKYTFT